jgi:hypothetical protein
VYQVSYQHVPELANPFIAETWADTVSLTRYREHIRQVVKPHIVRLREQLRHGPLLLISRSARHEGSERECVVDELARIDSSFDLALAEW